MLKSNFFLIIDYRNEKNFFIRFIVFLIGLYVMLLKEPRPIQIGVNMLRRLRRRNAPWYRKSWIL